MPTKKKKDVGRINVRCEAWFANRVADAAKSTGRSMSSYVRVALLAQMKRDACSAEPPADEAESLAESGEPVKKRGRPKK